MWQPRDWNDVKVAIGSLEEAPDLDFKKQVSSNREISKDIAAMTLLGGVLAYGIEADKQERAVAAPKVPLAGLQEKIQAIVNTTIAPIPAIEFTVLREQQTDADGVLVVTIPRSLLCPHMSHGRFPARANTVTRELTEPEVAALYEQRRSVLQPPGETDILDGFVEPVQEIRSAVGIGAMRLMITPFGHPRHPAGYRLKKPLEQAVVDSRPVVDALVKPAFPPKAMEWLREWEPRGTVGWQAGFIGDPLSQGGSSMVYVGATCTHDLRLSCASVMSLVGEEGGGRSAFEHLWAAEMIGLLAIAGNFLLGVPGVTLLRVDLSLRGLDGSVSYASSRGRAFPPGQTTITDTDYRERIDAGVRQCAKDPGVPARELLDRLFASFLAPEHDPFRTIAP